MLRELIDIASLEDFVHGLSRCAGLRVCTYDSRGTPIVTSGSLSGFARLTGRTLPTIPAGQPLTAVPAHDPPGQVAFVEDRGVWYVAAPVYVQGARVGWVTVGEFREPPQETGRPSVAAAAHSDLREVIGLWARLPPLDRRGDSHAVVTARWGARQLAERCRRESLLMATSEEAALVGDIAELLTGRGDLQTILDRIVADTARVMKCSRCSLRLYDPHTNELHVKAVHNLSRRYLDKGVVRRRPNSIDDEALTGKLVYIADAATDPRVQYRQEMRQEGIASMLTAGMIYHGQPIGVIRVYTDRPQRFRRPQRSLLRAVAHQAATAIVHTRLIGERLRSAQTERQVALAGELQARMMRTPPPQHPGVVTAIEYQPSSHLGGDFCEVFRLGDGRLGAVVADVVGKGIPASILSAAVRGALRAGADSCRDLGELLTRLNRQVCAETLPAEFVTLLTVAVDVQQRRLSYCNAGHEPLLLLRGGQVQRLAEGDLVLGLNPDERYREHTSALEPGDLLLLYTDGVIEALNFADELFGRERLAAALQAYGDLAVDQVLRNVLWDVRRFVGLAEQVDDLTMVVLRVLPEQGG